MILRVFPSRTNATPRDGLCAYDVPGLYDPPPCDEVHVSCTFSWDRKRAERFADEWSKIHPAVKLGGPAFGDPGGEFEPGRYLAPGHVITSRGCPENCWFCDVPKREGGIRPLVVKNGYKLHDSNLLACPQDHQHAVFEMLQRQPKRPEFVGGIEAARLTRWHVSWFQRLKPTSMYFAYDTPNDLEPLERAGEMLSEFHAKYAYVLIGYKGDTFAKAEGRLYETIRAGFMPFAMLFRDRSGRTDVVWRRFQRSWCRPAAVRSKMKANRSGFEEQH